MFSSSPVASSQSKSSTSVSVELLFPFLASRYVFLSPSYSTQHVHSPDQLPSPWTSVAVLPFFSTFLTSVLSFNACISSSQTIPSPRLLILPPPFHSLPQVLIHPLDLNLPLPAAAPQINFSSSQLFPKFQLNISTDNWIPAPECLPSPQTQTHPPETVLLSTL